MTRDDGRMTTAAQWKELWGGSDSEEEGDNYVLPKVYPGPKIRCPNCGHWQVWMCRRASTEKEQG